MIDYYCIYCHSKLEPHWYEDYPLNYLNNVLSCIQCYNETGVNVYFHYNEEIYDEGDPRYFNYIKLGVDTPNTYFMFHIDENKIIFDLNRDWDDGIRMPFTYLSPGIALSIFNDLKSFL